MGIGVFRKSTASKKVTKPSSRPSPRMLEPLEGRVLLSTVPNDPMFNQQWHLQNTGQLAKETSGERASVGIAGDDIDAPLAWDITKGSNDVVIAVIDSGIDITHPDLAANIFTNPNEIPGNGVDDDNNGYIDDIHGWDFYRNIADVSDLNGHGTHVAGIIGADGNNGIGVSGVNWNVTILPIKVATTGNGVSFDATIKGIRYVTALKHAGVNVVAMNMSIGGPGFPYNANFANAIADAGRAGILSVVAAGNDALVVDRQSVAPAKFSISQPSVITVAATNNQDQLAAFSNTGYASVQVGSPGVAITSTWSRTVDADDNGTPDNTMYQSISGTSMAAPVVTGIIGLMAAANPNATLEQLKTALFNGVDQIPALSPVYSLPGKVNTFGRVNAYSAILAIQNRFVRTDTTTSGNWIGAYGSEGQFVQGDTANFPLYVHVGLDNGYENQVYSTTRDVAALQRLTNPADRIVNHIATAGTMSLELNFVDGQSHRVSFYMTDADRRGRVQVVQLFDYETGRLLDARTVSNFTRGQYLTYDLAGHVQLRIVNVNPRSTAVLDGIFFDPAPTGEKQFIGENSADMGFWRNHYGTQGQFILGQSIAPPSFVGLNITGATPSIRTPLRNPRALELATDPRLGTASEYITTGTMTVDLNFTDGQTHRVSLYAVDLQRLGRAQRIDVVDVATGALLSSREMSDFKNGKYLSWNLSGHVQIHVTRTAGPTAAVSGIFFDAPQGSTAEFIGLDSNTNGGWRGTYGNEGALVVGEQAAFPPVAPGSSITGAYGSMLRGSTFDPRAMQKISTITDRIAAYYATATSMNIDLHLVDSLTHRVALYAADFERAGRAQRIEVIDPDTGTILASQDMRQFDRRGKYAVFEVRGHVQIRITRLAGPSAILNGILFG